jgi:ribose transport system ATP-binding protein
VTILFISHRLEEVFEIADSILVLKDGRVSHYGEMKGLTQDDVIRHMIGRKLDSLYPEGGKEKDEIRLEVRNLESRRAVRDVSFAVREGEVLGIGGLVGSGRTELVRAVFSADRRDKGEILLDGKRQCIGSPREAVRAGIGFVPEDRKTQGILLSFSIRKNLTITNLNSISSVPGFILKSREKEKSKDLINLLDIRTGSVEFPAEQLSGGNQQKLVLAKWLGRTCRVIIMDEPTRGIDVGAKAEIYRLIRDLSGQGISIVMVSSEMTELIGMCDRILVMKDGRINGELNRKEFTEENILRLSVVNDEI